MFALDRCVGFAVGSAPCEPTHRSSLPHRLNPDCRFKSRLLHIYAYVSRKSPNIVGLTGDETGGNLPDKYAPSTPPQGGRAVATGDVLILCRRSFSEMATLSRRIEASGSEGFPECQAHAAAG